MLRNYARLRTALLVTVLWLLTATAVHAQTDTPTPTADACATDAASRWETVMAYSTITPTATATPYVDLAVNEVLTDKKLWATVGEDIDLTVGLVNVGTSEITETVTISIYQYLGGGVYHERVRSWYADIAVGQSVRFNTLYTDVVDTTSFNVELVGAEINDTNAANDATVIELIPDTPTPSPTPYIDMAITKVEIEPAPPVPAGTDLTVYVAAENRGTGTVTETIEFAFYQQSMVPFMRYYQYFDWMPDVAPGAQVMFNYVYTDVLDIDSDSFSVEINVPYDADNDNDRAVVYLQHVTATPPLTISLPYSQTAIISLNTDIGAVSLGILVFCAGVAILLGIVFVSKVT